MNDKDGSSTVNNLSSNSCTSIFFRLVIYYAKNKTKLHDPFLESGRKKMPIGNCRLKSKRLEVELSVYKLFKLVYLFGALSLNLR